ncbi:MAG TPA: hypothetical protein VHM29_09750, partial [Acidimicrobiia bacterium]|nr:hypothetical protein [Acidimicrobiia bacterium]
EPASIYEVQGYVEIWVGRLTPENIAAVSEVVDGAPVCISGQDPTTTPADGPQPEGGDGWMYLAEADTMLESELPRILAEARSLATVWTQLGLEGNPPVVDFDRQLVFYLVIGHSGSCPDTRLDDVSIDGDHVYAVIPTITDAMGCTSDWVPRTYLAAVDRDRLPAPPFQVTAERQYGARVKVTADLRVPGSVPAPGEVSPAEVLPVREPTPMPYWIETDFPWPMTIDPTCGVDYLGQINHVHWHQAEGSGMPEAWKVAIIDGLLDVELMMTPGPEPTLTASTGGVEVLYLPGPETQPVCN